MADKLAKAIESLKALAANDDRQKRRDPVVVSKEKISLCSVVADHILSPVVRSHTEYTKLFSQVLELFLSLYNDPDADIRLTVDSSINRLIKHTLIDTHATRIQVELFKELKQNGPVRSLRAAMSKFALLAPNIRVQKARAFAVALVSITVAISKRPEDSVQESLQEFVERVWPVLGQFFSDDETKVLLKSFLPNLQLQSLVSRRTAAAIVVLFCSHSRKPDLFAGYLLKVLLDTIIPIQYDQSVQQLLGVFFALKHLMPLLRNACEQTGEEQLKFTPAGVGVKVQPVAGVGVGVEQLLQLYEVILYYVAFANVSVSSAALDCLTQLLVNVPSELGAALVAPDGVRASRIHSASLIPGGATSARSRMQSTSARPSGFSRLSGVSSLSGSQTDLTILGLRGGDLSIVDDEPQVFANVDDTAECADYSQTRPVVLDKHAPSSSSAYSSATFGEEDDDSSESAPESEFSDPLRAVAGEIDEGRRKLLELPDLKPSISPTQPIEPSTPTTPRFPSNLFANDLLGEKIGSFTDATPSLLYCSRLLCSKFLLTGVPGELTADRDVRVSQKASAMSALEAVIALYPEALLATVFVKEGQGVGDVLLYMKHQDPQLRAQRAGVCSQFIQGFYSAAMRERMMGEAADAPSSVETIFQLHLESVRRRMGGPLSDRASADGTLSIAALLKSIVDALEDESAVVVRAALQALDRLLYLLYRFDGGRFLLKTLPKLFALIRNPYFLLKIDLANFLSSIDFCSLAAAADTSTLTRIQEELLVAFVEHLLVDDDARVRQAACGALCGLVGSIVGDGKRGAAMVLEKQSARELSALSVESSSAYGAQVLCQMQEALPVVHGLVEPYAGALASRALPSMDDENVARFVRMLVAQMEVAASKNVMIGSIGALASLSERFKPVLHAEAWLCTSGKTGAHGVLALLLSELVGGTHSILLDFVAHEQCLRLVSNWFAGFVMAVVGDASTKRSSAASVGGEGATILAVDEALAKIAQDFMLHCLRLLNIYWHALTDQIVTPSAALRQQISQTLPTPPAVLSSPKRRLGATAKSLPLSTETEKTTTQGQVVAPSPGPAPKVRVGDCAQTVAQFARMLDVVRSANAAYKVTLEEAATERFVGLLRAALAALAQLLEVASLVDVNKYGEEILLYLKACSAVAPLEAVLCVQQLLKSLFAINLNFLMLGSQGEADRPSNADWLRLVRIRRRTGLGGVQLRGAETGEATAEEESLFVNFVVRPYTLFAQGLATAGSRHDLLSGSVSRHLGWFGLKSDKHVLALLKNANRKSALSSFIRLFEPVVIHALKTYTNTNDTLLQRQIIYMVVQLVQVRVNYSMLDADFKFLQFVYQQLEAIEEGQIHKHADPVIKALFEYFITLSYERYSGRPVVDVPKIMQLCDGLIASGQSPVKTVIPVLHVVVLDLFLIRPSAKIDDPKDLDAQKEVVLYKMIMKLLSYAEAVDLLSIVLYQTKIESEERWRRLSRDVVDVLLPLIGKLQINFADSESVRCVQKTLDLVSPSAFLPVDALLQWIFSPQSLALVNAAHSDESLREAKTSLFKRNKVQMFERWFAAQLVLVRTLLLRAKEDAILSRLEQMNVGTGGTPQELIAKLLLTCCECAVLELCRLVCEPTSANAQDWAFLTAMTYDYSMIVLHLNLSGSFKKISTAFSHLLARAETLPQRLFGLDIAARREFSHGDSLLPMRVLWLNIFAAVHLFELRVWRDCLGRDDEALKRIAVILYCDHWKGMEMDGEVVEREVVPRMELVVEMCEEAPVAEALSRLYANETGSRAFLTALVSWFNTAKLHPTMMQKVLRVCEPLHFSVSGALVHFLVECFLRSPLIAIGRRASAIACRRLELLLVSRSEEAMENLTADRLREVLDVFAEMKLRNRYAQLYALLVRLASVWYPNVVREELEPEGTVCVELREMLHSALSKFNKLKCVQLVKAFQSSATPLTSPRVYAQLLTHLRGEEVLEILTTEGISPDVLRCCLELGVERMLCDLDWSSTESSSPTDAGVRESPRARAQEALAALVPAPLTGELQKYPLLWAAKTAVLRYLKNVLLAGQPVGVRFERTTFSVDERHSPPSSNIVAFAACVERFLTFLPVVPPVSDAELRALIAFAEQYIQVVLADLHFSTSVDALRFFSSFFANANVVAVLNADEERAVQATMVSGVFFLLRDGLRLAKSLGGSELAFEIDDEGVATTWQHMRTMLAFVEKSCCEETIRTAEVPAGVITDICRTVLGLARLTTVTTLCRTPLLAFRYGWTPVLKQSDPPTLPPVPVHYLQNNPDVLREFVRLANLLGWTNRAQFEETWMVLLGVLSSTPIGAELSQESTQEVSERICASSLAVRCMTSLLLQALLVPRPGNPSVGHFLLTHRESRRAAFLRTRSGRRLRFLKARMACADRRTRFSKVYLQANSKVPLYGANIERLWDLGTFSLSQLSIETLWSITGILAEERSLLAQKPVAPATPVSMGTAAASALAANLPHMPSPSLPPQILQISGQIQSVASNIMLQFPTAMGGGKARSSDDAAPTMLDPLSLALAQQQRQESVSPTIADPPPLPVAEPAEPSGEGEIRKSSSSFLLVGADSGLDLVSSLHFLLDLYTHWLSTSPDDVPLSLLLSTVESMVLLSDVFTERAQYEWLLANMRGLMQTHSPQIDEILFQYIVVGTLKAIAVLGATDTDTKRHLLETLDLALENPHLSIRLCALSSSLYLLQAVTGDETLGVLPSLCDYVLKTLERSVNGKERDLLELFDKPQNMQHLLMVWAVGFYVAENFHDEQTKTSFSKQFLEICVKFVQTPVGELPPPAVFRSVVYGVQSFLVSSPINAKLIRQLTNAMTEIIKSIHDVMYTAPCIELLLACLYLGKAVRPFDSESADAPDSLPEQHISAMEKLSLFLTKISKGSPEEADVIGSILPSFLADNFAPGDVINKIICELLLPVQPRPAILARVLFDVFDALREKETAFVVSDWALLSLPSFTSTTLQVAVWSLTCFLLSASSNAWVRAIFPVGLERLGKSDAFDVDLLAFAVGCFRAQLEDASQREALVLTLKDAVRRHPDSGALKAALETVVAFR